MFSEFAENNKIILLWSYRVLDTSKRSWYTNITVFETSEHFELLYVNYYSASLFPVDLSVSTQADSPGVVSSETAHQPTFFPAFRQNYLSTIFHQ